MTSQTDAFPGQPSAPTGLVPSDWLDVLPPQAECLRDYQRQILAEIPGVMRRGVRRIVVQAPTGSGKGHLIAAVVAAAFLAGLRILVLATRTRLVRQIHQRLTEFGVSHGVIAAPLPELLNHSQAVQVASVDTLYRRAIVDNHMTLPAAEIVVADECHLFGADSRLAILDSYPAAWWLGFTATPARKSGRGLGAVFDYLVLGPSIRWLITVALALVRLRIFNTPVVTERELAEVPKGVDNDYQAGALGKLLSRPKLIGDVLQNWLRLAAGKRTIVFACDKSHGAQLTAEFCQAGVPAELLTDADSEEIREEVFARLESGKTLVVVNVFLAAYGLDIPSVECVVLARPTRSVVMFLQMVGRGMRPAPGKVDCLVIDHGRCVETLGLPHADRQWTLDDTTNVNTEARERYSRRATTEKPRTCPECKHLWLVSEEGEACRECGWIPAPKPKRIAVQDANLKELAEDDESDKAASARVERFFREALGDYIRSKPEKWKASPNTARAASWYATREKFKLTEERVPRNYWQLDPMPPSIETVGWLTYRRIKFARSRPRA